ncbi:hypothetical protein WDW86_16985, partial [Bdellovibrionota bacterium FG-2]
MKHLWNLWALALIFLGFVFRISKWLADLSHNLVSESGAVAAASSSIEGTTESLSAGTTEQSAPGPETVSLLVGGGAMNEQKTQNANISPRGSETCAQAG